MLLSRPLAGLALTVTACVLGLTTAAAPARADSIVYEKGGNVWLTSPDGSKGYQVTFDGGWESPSQADDGTIVAAKGTSLVRMDRSGRIIGQPVSAVGGATGTIPGEQFKLFGPFDPQVSPDGRRIAYWATAYTPTSSGDVIYTDYRDIVLVTPSDHFAMPREAWTTSVQTPSWIGDDHVLMAGSGVGSYNFQTWEAGRGDDHVQWWFHYVNAMEADAELSPDGRKLVSVAQTNGLLSPKNTLHFFSVPGPAWTPAPYPDTWNTLDESVPRPPQGQIRCQNVRDSEVHSPTWSPSSDAIAYDDKDGVWVEQAGDFGDCASLGERLLVPGGRHPDWGPADVVTSQDPRNGGGQDAGPSIHTQRRVGRGGRLAVRITSAAPGRLRLTVCRRLASGCRPTGVHRSVRVRTGVTVAGVPLRRLSRGRYVLVARRTGEPPLRAPFRVV